MKKRTALLFLLSTLFASTSAYAGTYYVEKALIDDVSIFAIGASGHHAGNLEIKVRGGFVLPAGATCTDRVYLTTLKSVDADKRLLTMLLAAQTTKQQVTIFLTDDPAYTAFPGRCSLVAVSLTSGQ